MARQEVIGGTDNTVESEQGSILAGENNTDAGSAGFLEAGRHNTVSGEAGTIPGGKGNAATGTYSAVPGGTDNVACGDDSFAMGNNATVEADGAVAFADETDEEFRADNAGLHTQMPAFAPELYRRVGDGRVDTDRLDAEDVPGGLTDIDVGVTADGEGPRIDAEAFNDAFDPEAEDELGTLSDD